MGVVFAFGCCARAAQGVAYGRAVCGVQAQAKKYGGRARRLFSGHFLQGAHGPGLALHGCGVEQEGGPHTVLGHPQPRAIELTESGKGLGLLLGRRPAVPGCGSLEVFGHAASQFVKHAQIVLGHGLALAGARSNQRAASSGLAGMPRPCSSTRP